MENNTEHALPPTPPEPPRMTPPPPPPPFTPAPRRDNLGMKVLLIAIISAVLMIPSLIISALVSSRERTEETTVNEISDSWSGSQLISGPIISIPYDSISSRNKGGTVRLLPSQMNFKADIKSQQLHRGIYEAVVYNSEIVLAGTFSYEPLAKLGIPLSAYHFDKAYVTVGIGDLRGVENVSPVTIDGKTYELEGTNNSQVYTSYSEDEYIVYVDSSPASGCMQANIQIADADTASFAFSLTMSLRGSGSLGVTPVGHRNDIEIKGDGKSPSFKGMFLPGERTVNKSDFMASWTLNSTNRNYPQAFVGSKADDISKSAVIVDLLVPVDRYQKTDRAIKYAIVVILLTFIAILLAELVMRHPINMLQYLLVGLALVLFYSLLLSMSEHLSFGLSYLLAAIMTIGLITLYMRGILGSVKVAGAICGLLTVIYVFIYVLLSLETYALLTGSVGLFIALAAVMYATLKLRIDNR